jgi:cytochrome c-type biogenesis protein
MTSVSNFPLIAGFTAGLFTFASPCVLPLIPVYISFITGVSINELKNDNASSLARTFLSALFFVAGFSLVFIMLGASASYLGGLFGAHKELIRWIGGGAVIIFGLHLAGVFRIKLLYFEKRLGSEKLTGGYIGAFLVGIAFGAGWTPCIGPILSSILILASTQDTVYKGMILLLAYSAGLGLPLLLTALFVNIALGLFSKIKKYYGFIETASGVILVLMGVLIISNNFKWLSQLSGRYFG